MKAILALLMLATVAAAGDLRVKLDVRTSKDSSGTRFQNHVELTNKTGASMRPILSAFALTLVDGAYRVDAVASSPAELPANGKKVWTAEALGTDPRVKWSWLVIAVSGDKVIASVWKYERKRIDPALFIGAKVGDVIAPKAEDGNDGKKDEQP